VTTARFLLFTLGATAETFPNFNGTDSEIHKTEPLFYYLFPLPTPLVADSVNGIDWRSCGNEAAPCKTLSLAFARRAGAKSVSVRGPFELWEELVLGGGESYTVSGAAGGTRIVVEAVGGSEAALMTTSCISSFTDFEFQLPTTLGSQHTSLLLCTTASLTLSGCSVIPAGGISSVSYSFATANGGTLSLTDFSCTATFTFSGFAMLAATGSGTLSLTGAKFENVKSTATGLLALSSTQSLSLHTTNFSSHTLAATAILSVSSVTPASLTDANFSEISRSSGHGSSLTFTRGSTAANVELELCSFTGCTVSEADSGGRERVRREVC
jgi:hypothetical protein